MRATDDSSRSGVDSPSTQSRPGMRRRLGSNDDASSSARVNVSLHSSSGQRRNILRHAMSLWMPAEEEITNRSPRSWRRRVFLIITEPETSILSAVFYILLMSGIFVVNIIMVMQTMESWQYTPTDCVTCGGNVTYFFEDDDTFLKSTKAGVRCTCPPEPQKFLVDSLDFLMKFFLVEWCIRVLTFVAKDPAPDVLHQFFQWLEYLTSSSTLMDALAIFPYYLESLPNTFVSLRLLRLFRIFQLLRLGQYNNMFLTLTNVLAKSLTYLRLLILILAFGGAFFGSMIYWVERGTWAYHDASGKYLYVRLGVDGITEEPSPFRSIPAAFWWFMVTATTVGYGDYYPTSTVGKWVACVAMLMGVLVIAFPVSVFSDLWSQELKEMKGFEYLNSDESHDDDEEAEPLILSSRTLDAAMTENTPLRQHQLSGRSHEPTRGSVMMKKEDLKAIVECVYNMKENQRQLHSILRKYRLVEETDPPTL